MDSNSPAKEAAAPGRGTELEELSRRMVRLYKEQFGRGPTKAHSVYATPDLLICSLEETMTPAERSLVALGEHQRLRDVRLFFQHATEQEFIRTVKETTGRDVRAFVSGMDTEQDVSTEVFYLQPIAHPTSG